MKRIINLITYKLIIIIYIVPKKVESSKSSNYGPLVLFLLLYFLTKNITFIYSW
jgi:hypothetical protein